MFFDLLAAIHLQFIHIIYHSFIISMYLLFLQYLLFTIICTIFMKATFDKERNNITTNGGGEVGSTTKKEGLALYNPVTEWFYVSISACWYAPSSKRQQV